MAISDDNQLETQTAGTADWDSALNANFTILERGQHVTVPAGNDINTGYVCWIDSGGYAHHYDTNSVDIRPHGFAWTGANSGDDLMLLVRGSVRSLDITSTVVPGINAYVSGATPGLVVNSYSGSYPPIGWGQGTGQLYFDPHLAQPMERITAVHTENPTVESMHLFTMDLGRYGWVREVDMKAESGDLIRLWFYSNSNRAAGDLLYQVLSGGVDATSQGDFGGFYDRAGWPFENTDASTINGLIYGVVEVHSLGSVGSTNLNITLVAERRM
jgi:hypothetical protein